MDLALAFTALLMGLAGAPHCAAMCGPACAALVRRGATSRAARPSTWAFHAARLASYALAGALAAAGVGVLAWAGQSAAWLRPVWSLLHVGALALGLWLAITGRQPAWMTRIGRTRDAHGGSGSAGAGAVPVGWSRLSGPASAAGAGALWAAWPCGLLQSALVVAALANTPQAGALVMTAFGLSSATGLVVLPWAWRRWAARGDAAGDPGAGGWTIRLAGALLAAGSLWALGQDLWMRVWDYCFG